MFGSIIEFLQDDRGAITVDWVVLTAGVIGISLAVLAMVTGGTTQLSTKMSGRIVSHGNTTW